MSTTCAHYNTRRRKLGDSLSIEASPNIYLTSFRDLQLTIKYCPSNNTIHTRTMSFALKATHQNFCNRHPSLRSKKKQVGLFVFCNDDGITRQPKIGLTVLTEMLVSVEWLSRTWSILSLRGHFVM